jgi:hypothetical protein
MSNPSESPTSGAKSFAEMAGETLREAGLLVAVFGWLDKAVQGEAFLGVWSWKVLGFAIVLYLLGVMIERRRGA